MAEEYYIRDPDSDAAKGPYNIDKLATLAEADQLSLETLYYDDELETWAAIGSNEELKSQIYPERKKLALRKKTTDEMNLLNQEAQYEDEDASLSVEGMLAAAEGKSSDTKHIQSRQSWQARAAGWSVPVLGTIFLVSALSTIYPSWDIVQLFLAGDETAYDQLLARPLLVLGVLDLFVALGLYLSVTELYPLVRIRALFGIGYFGASYWGAAAIGMPHAPVILICILAAYIGAYITTIAADFRVMILCAVLGLLGILGYGYFTTLIGLMGDLLGSGATEAAGS